MEFLNNLNVILGTIVSAIAILTTIISCIKFLLKKASTSQPKIAQQRMPRKRSSYQTIVKPLNKLDWMEVLWTGFEDCLRAREGQGWIVSVMIGVFGGLFIGLFTSRSAASIQYLSLVIFYTLFFCANLLFYVYFVGRRIEKKVGDIH